MALLSPILRSLSSLSRPRWAALCLAAGRWGERLPGGGVKGLLFFLSVFR